MRAAPRPVAVITAVSLTVGFFVAMPQPARAADPTVTLTKDAQPTVLAGESIHYSLRIENPASSSQTVFNVSFSDTLPLGVTYKAGSVTAPFPAPTTRTDPATGRQVLVWSDLSDLAVSDSLTIEFDGQTSPNTAAQLVGAPLTNTATGVASTNPREVPSFGTDGQPVLGPGAHRRRTGK